MELVKFVVVEYFILEKFRFVVGLIGLGIKLFIFGYIDFVILKDSFIE